MKKLISVIVPVYNTSMYLRQCLDSIKNQTLKDIEVIVVDDGSTDDSPAICDEFSDDSRFRIFHNKNIGVSETRNFGIKEAHGEYCMFVDSDDWLDCTMCEDLLNEAVRSNFDLVICGNYNESTNGTSARHLYRGDKLFEGGQYVNDISVRTLGLTEKSISNPAKLDKLTPVWARLYRTSIIKEHNISFIDLDKLPSECMQFNFEYCVQAKKAYYIDKVLYHYRRNTIQSVTKPYRKNLLGKWKWWFDYEKDYIECHALRNRYMEAFYSRACCSTIPLGGNAIKLQRGIMKECKEFLSSSFLEEAFTHFDYSSCPIYWRLFFWSAKTKKVLLFYLLTKAMRKILERRKK